MIASDFQQQSVDLCRAGGLPAACRDVLHLLRWLHDRGAEQLLEVSDGHFAMNAAYPGEPKEFVREAEVLRFLRAHLYGVLCVRAVSPGRSRRR